MGYELLSRLLFHIIIGLIFKTLWECVFGKDQQKNKIIHPPTQVYKPKPRVDYSDHFWDIYCEDMKAGCIMKKN